MSLVLVFRPSGFKHRLTVSVLLAKNSLGQTEHSILTTIYCTIMPGRSLDLYDRSPKALACGTFGEVEGRVSNRVVGGREARMS